MLVKLCKVTQLKFRDPQSLESHTENSTMWDRPLGADGQSCCPEVYSVNKSRKMKSQQKGGLK